MVQVDGHKMTKATFRQILWRTLDEWPGDDNVLGWVNDGEKILIWTKEGRLYRSNFESWVGTRNDGTEVFLSEVFEQLFIAT